ncbi:MAG: glycosyltransferase family 4 protein [Cytophagia bacterium]|jgi:glycosyltransferase involved in cell wall biosynthesis|nr:glycosyltransferase family 4 protein [Cytophagia bacterium]
MPSEPGGTRSYWISQELISRGHTVIMVTSSQTISRKKEIKVVDGIKVIYLKVPYDNSMGFYKRLWSFLIFIFRCSFVALKQKEVDLVIATSTPLTIGFPALLLRYTKGIQYLFEVRDLWPEVPIQMGGLRSPLLKKLSVDFERLIYKKAKHIVALSPGMKDGVVKKETPSQKVTMIPNMAKIDKFWARELNPGVFQRYNLNKNSFKIVHFGAMGLANGLDYIIDAATKLKKKNIKDIDFVFLGDGAVKNKLETETISKALSNIIFLGKFPMDETSKIVNACDVSLVTFLNLPILATNSPNKLFDSLSAGKPIIVNSNGWTREMVEENDCGFYVDATKPEELVELLVQIKSQKTMLTQMGKNARLLAETKYDKSILCKQFAEIIESKF